MEEGNQKRSNQEKGHWDAKWLPALCFQGTVSQALSVFMLSQLLPASETFPNSGNSDILLCPGPKDRSLSSEKSNE
jgi:hypothetical protein